MPYKACRAFFSGAYGTIGSYKVLHGFEVLPI